MKVKLSFLFILISIFINSETTYSQCTEAKDADMAKYKRLTETQDAQGCSQCAMLALYLCSARNTVTVEDKRMVSSLITQTKGNIVNMGQPYCCPELVSLQPQWGIDVGGNSSFGQSTVNTAIPSTNLESELLVAATTTIINEVVPMIEQWSENRDIKKEAESVKLENEKKINVAKWEDFFKPDLDEYLTAADNGDEKARMKLLFKLRNSNYQARNLDYEDVRYLIPKWKDWVKEAAENKNLDAMNYIGNSVVMWQEDDLGITKEEGLKMLEEAANFGSTDAMLLLGNYYYLNTKCLGKPYGGGSSEKSLYWFRKAAEEGSKRGNYLMGMLYRYKETIPDFPCHVKYDFKKDDKLAFDFFQKSISIQDEVETDFYKETYIYEYSDSYLELAIMYSKGIACEKDIEYSNKLYQLSAYKIR